MAIMNPVATTKKRSTSYKVISPPPFPFRIRGEEVAAVALGDFLMGIISALTEDGNRDNQHGKSMYTFRKTFSLVYN